MELHSPTMELANLQLSCRVVPPPNIFEPGGESRGQTRPRLVVRSSSRRRAASNGIQDEPNQNLSRILRTEAAILSVDRKARSSKSTRLWPRAVLEALDDAISNHRWESALRIFRLMRKQHWYEPKCQTYAKLLTMIGKCMQPDHAFSLFQEMVSEGLRPTLEVYTALVGAYGHNGLLEKAFHTIDEMKTIADCKPDSYTYAILINCCSKMRRFDLISKLLDEMSYLGIKSNTVTYNAIIDGYGKAGMLEEMETTLSDMLENGSGHPDTFTLNSIISAYGNRGSIDKLESWYEEFRYMGVDPDVTTFNIMIKSYGKSGLYEKMGLVMEFMKRRFFSPTVVTFNIIIECFGRVGNIEKMEYFFRSMKIQGIKPNSVTYCSLVNGYSKSGILDKVPTIIRQTENTDVVLDAPFFNCVISAYGQAGEVKIMQEMFLLMKEKKCEPDSITYATMVQAYGRLGMVEAAQELEAKMHKLNNRVLEPG